MAKSAFYRYWTVAIIEKSGKLTTISVIVRSALTPDGINQYFLIGICLVRRNVSRFLMALLLGLSILFWQAQSGFCATLDGELKQNSPVDYNFTYNMGMKHYKGDGAIQDYKEAAKFFAKAVKGGDQEANYMLGIMYYKGEGFPQSYQRAIKQFNRAAIANNVNAQNRFG
ncbi:MAG: sel1 repeat family protein [Magnetococcales bacterium]|nr:sel1 repeat family protein [Magnetococcales bacterium]